MNSYYVYILASRKNGTLYVGVTNDLVRRAYDHKSNVIQGFTEKYGVHNLVYYESYTDVRDALTREKRLKKWKRQWKINLIETKNPDWIDLYEQIISLMDSRLRGNDAKQ
jgi:putative endonuclease